MYTRRCLWTVAIMLLAMAYTSGWAGNIVSTFDVPMFLGKPGTPIIGVNDAIPGTGRACWDSPLGGYECGQRIASWKAGRVAWSFIAPTAASADGVEVILGLQPQSAGHDVTIALHGDSSGLPGAVLRSATVKDKMSECYLEGETPLTRGAFESPYPLVRGMQYWVSVTMKGETGGHWHFNGPTSSGDYCAGGRIGSGARMAPGADTWAPLPEVNLLSGCSAAFRVTSPEPPGSQPTLWATFPTTPY